MAIWIKPNGTEIEIGDGSSADEYCKSLGWEKKRGRPAGSTVKKKVAKKKAAKKAE